MDSHNIQEFLGVDAGAARVGIARGNSAARLAQPLVTVEAVQAADKLIELAKAHSADAVVVGLPRSLDGRETAQTQTVKQWVGQIKDRINLPFYWQDEALTTQKAESLAPKVNGPGADAEAAAIILQDFLDTAEDDRVAV